MKNKTVQFLVAAAVALPLIFSTLGPAQQADQAPPSTTPTSSSSGTQQHHANEAQIPASGEVTTHEAKTFSGQVQMENGELVLKDPVTKVSYKLSDTSKAKAYRGKSVKVTGKLDLNSNVILVERIVAQSAQE